MQDEERLTQDEEYVAVGAYGTADQAEQAPEAGQESRRKVPEPAAKEEKPQKTASRRTILHVVAGGYLLYLAYKLLEGFITDFPTAGWTANIVVCLIGAVLFAVVGVILLVGVVKQFIRDAGNKK